MFSTKIRVLVQQQWAGLIALFLVLTAGSASALGGSNTVFSDDIVDGQVKEADVGQAAVTSAEVKDDSLLPADVAPNSLTSGRIANGTLTGTDVAGDSLTGADVGEATLSDAILQRRIGASCPSGQAIRVVGQNGAVTCQALTGSSPLGPAGGDLTGNYPNPAIRSNAVNSSAVENFSLNDEDVGQGTFVNFAADIGLVPPQSCIYKDITGINAQGDHLLLTPSNEDAFLIYDIQYRPGQESARLQICNPFTFTAQDEVTHFNLLVIDAQ